MTTVAEDDFGVAPLLLKVLSLYSFQSVESSRRAKLKAAYKPNELQSAMNSRVTAAEVCPAASDTTSLERNG